MNRTSKIGFQIVAAMATVMALLVLGACEPKIESTPGQGPCGPDTCAEGCCDSTGQCIRILSDFACTRGGRSCEACPAGLTCDKPRGTCVNQGDIFNPSGSCQDCFNGCCDPQTGLCRSGFEDSFCGVNGLSCQNCTTQGMACGQGSCQQNTCGSSCLSGCCLNGQCADGNSDQACGQGGGVCSQCGPGQRCIDHRCQASNCGPGNCNGCCDAQGACQNGDSDTFCGQGGQSCRTCQQGMACSAQKQCQSQATICGPNNCNGCCDEQGRCIDTPDAQRCGGGGGVCQRCGDGLTCDAGQCRCTAASCTGCCDPTGQCRVGAERHACGTFGGSCQDCGSGSCSQGQCRDFGVFPQDCFSGCVLGNRCFEGNQDNACGQFAAGCQDCSAVGAKCDSIQRLCINSQGARVQGPVPGQWTPPVLPSGIPLDAVWDIYITNILVVRKSYDWGRPENDPPELLLEVSVGGSATFPITEIPPAYEATWEINDQRNLVGWHVTTKQLLDAGLLFSVFDKDTFLIDSVGRFEKIAVDCFAPIQEKDLLPQFPDPLSDRYFVIDGCPGSLEASSLLRTVFTIRPPANP